jgi:hypothetical protein
MPALVNMSVGSSFTTMGAEGTMACCLERKKSRKACRIAALLIIKLRYKGLIFAFLRAIFVFPARAGQR